MKKRSKAMAMAEHQHPFFYGSPIIRNQEREYIESLLAKYRGQPLTDQLRKQIWEELQMEKHLGHIKIPFKLATRKDSSGKFPEYIEVILDTKV